MTTGSLGCLQWPVQPLTGAKRLLLANRWLFFSSSAGSRSTLWKAVHYSGCSRTRSVNL
jgi:hypothetical protein